MRQTTIFMPTEFAQTQIGDGEGEAGGTDSAERIIGITMRDLQQAAVEGVITNLQASKLWNKLAVTGIPVPNKAQETKFVPSAGYMETAPQALLPMPRTRPRFDVVKLLYWFGGLLVAGTIGLAVHSGYLSR